MTNANLERGLEIQNEISSLKVLVVCVTQIPCSFPPLRSELISSAIQKILVEITVLEQEFENL